MTAQVGLVALAAAIAVALVLLLPTETWVAIPILIAGGFALIAWRRSVGTGGILAGLGLVASVSLVIGAGVATLLVLGAGGPACQVGECDYSSRTVLAVTSIAATSIGLIGTVVCARFLVRVWRRDRLSPSPDS
jgi:hypothetical protein